MHVLQVVNYATEGKGMKNKGKLGITMMQVLELLRLAKNTSWDEATPNSPKIKPTAIAHCTDILNTSKIMYFNCAFVTSLTNS